MGKTIAAFVFLQIISICSSWPLSTNSRWIVDDASGQRVKLACVNWPSHLEPMIAEGVEKKPVSEIARKITASGFNCVRFTWATHMFTRPEYRNLKVSESLDKYNLSAARDGIVRNNPHILNMTVVELHKAVVDELGRNKLMVVLDNHIGRPGWCCSDNDGNGFFNDPDFNPWEWERGLVTVAKAYLGNPAVVGMSLRNELRGSRQNELNWYQYMRVGANLVHNQNPDVLVIVSGLSYAGNLAFLKSQPLDHIPSNKSVYEGHWYSFGIPADKWAAQTNQICASVTKATTDNLLFLTQGDNPFPLFLSEFGINQRGDNEADNRYIGCLLAAVAELDLDWALWALQGSYLLREGTVNLEEFDGVLDFNWDRIRNPSFLDKLQAIQHINQDFKSEHPTYYKMFHPLSGHCVQIVENWIVVANCKNASKWEQHQDDGPIKLVGSPQCLGVAVDEEAPRVSEDCSSKWKYVSSTGLHLAAHGGNGGYLCLEMNAPDSKLITKKCLCVGDNLVDLPTCAHNPQAQWFKFIPSNI
ncbi:glycosyl hydrolase 5 family protein-like [Salvia splendens]|uniref:glycosyl hydrolase 5 family protein-like n=1 Tax=Salvia splendens TaxID=180675 RepID=UPI001C258F3D|nr:glycosyl hydrolase 5 family protein-like [Salvia splendens]